MTAVAALTVLLLMGVAFVHEERRGRPERLVVLLFALLIIDSTLYADPFSIPDSVLRPRLGPLPLRLLDLVAIEAISVRLVWARWHNRGGLTPLLWLTFLLWLVTGVVVGGLRGGETADLLFQAKLILYLSLALLGAAVPAQRWLEPVVIRSLCWTAGLAALLIVCGALGFSYSVSLPTLPDLELGVVNSDLASIFAALGLVCLSMALVHHTARWRLLVSGSALLVITIPSGQRAAAIFVAVGLLVLGVAVTLTHRRLSTTPTETVLIVLALVATVLPLLVVRQAVDPKAALPFAATVQETFDGQAKKLSAQGRQTQLAQVRPLLLRAPVLGYGLGKTYRYYEPGPPARLVTSGITHNIATDLVLRLGLVGLLLFGAAMTSTVLDALRTWRRGVEPVLAAMALGLAAGVMAWVAKGLVESLFEKYRLAILLGLMIGVIRSLTTSQEAAVTRRDRSTSHADGTTGPTLQQ